jgi:MerR family transcriptional regulator, copper efflux regulator
METLTIGEVARGAGLGVETVRYYEREGLVPRPERSESGYRRFPPETVELLRFIAHGKRLGFSLKEIRELLALRIDTPSADACDEVRERAQIKLREVQDRIAALRRIEDVLTGLIGSCQTRAPTDTCPILDSIESTDNNTTQESE